MTAWKLFVGIAGSIGIFSIVGTLFAVILDWCGFFDDRSFQCHQCGRYFSDMRHMALVGDKKYCLKCCKSGTTGAKFTGNCVECGEEYPLAAMVGLNEKTICEPCWRNHLWPKDWRTYFKGIRETPARPPVSR